MGGYGSASRLRARRDRGPGRQTRCSESRTSERRVGGGGDLFERGWVGMDQPAGCGRVVIEDLVARPGARRAGRRTDAWGGGVTCLSVDGWVWISQPAPGAS